LKKKAHRQIDIATHTPWSTRIVDNGDAIVADLNALPVGFNNINSPCLPPYKVFEDNKFFGEAPRSLEIDGDPFPGFFASNATAILQFDKTAAQTLLEQKTRFTHETIRNTNIMSRFKLSARWRAPH
jgi:hypothetical protein